LRPKVIAFDNNFHLIRILGALAVIYGHAYPLTGVQGSPPEILGHPVHTFGLIMFFSISGFLVMKSLDQSRKVSGFFVKRVARIFPGLSVAVLMTVSVLGPAVSTLPANEYFANGKTISYLQNAWLFMAYPLPGVFEDLPFPSVVNGSLWTIPVEVACYLVLGLLLFGVKNRSTRLVILAVALVALALVIELWLVEKNSFVFYGTDWIISSTIMVFFFYGAVFYLVPERLLRLDLAILLLFFLILFAEIPLYSSVIQPMFLSYVIVAIGKAKSLLPTYVIRLGDPSYGTYLYAFPIQQTLIYLDVFAEHIELNILLVTFLSVSFGYLSWHVIEKPCLLRAREFMEPFEGVTGFPQPPIDREK
jgi:peptidoglycan/LPS O-acetylase OafA/YrhL